MIICNMFDAACIYVFVCCNLVEKKRQLDIGWTWHGQEGWTAPAPILK